MQGYLITYEVEPPEPVNPGGGEGRPTKYPWDEMDIGGSFWKQCEKGETPAQVGNKLTSAARNWSRNRMPGSLFTSRQEGNGARVWRIK